MACASVGSTGKDQPHATHGASTMCPPFEQVFSAYQASFKDMTPVKPLISYLLLLVDVGKEHSVAKELRRLPGVTEAQVVYGEFDVVARIEQGEVALMDETITMARKLPGVTRTSTLISSGIQS